LGGHALADGHDISVQTEVKELVRATVEAFGTVHIVVNNAGIAGQMSAHDAVNVESFTWTWANAALGTALVTEAVDPVMQGHGYGRIVNTSSDSIYGFGGGGDAGYVGSKGAVFGMARDLGRFSAQHGIRINGRMPSASSRMSDLSPLIKKITREHFDASQVAVFVAALASKECPVSGGFV
jgi:NAD(P)-dependent dehydrogenase (short-subunit alcohol dehydrogenase family)